MVWPQVIERMLTLLTLLLLSSAAGAVAVFVGLAAYTYSTQHCY